LPGYGNVMVAKILILDPDPTGSGTFLQTLYVAYLSFTPF
jgi:hypothetical protein